MNFGNSVLEQYVDAKKKKAHKSRSCKIIHSTEPHFYIRKKSYFYMYLYMKMLAKKPTKIHTELIIVITSGKGNSLKAVPK